MGVLDDFFGNLRGFEWDAGNSDKSWLRHQVRQAEAEQALLNRPVVVTADVGHSQRESRFVALGRTDRGRHLAIVFTIRGDHIRVISARSMSRSERRIYGQVKRATEADS